MAQSVGLVGPESHHILQVLIGDTAVMLSQIYKYTLIEQSDNSALILTIFAA